MAERTLTVKILGDEKDLLRSFKNSSTAAATFESRLSSVSTGVTRFARSAGLAAVAAGGVAAVLGTKFVTAASNLNEQVNRSNVVFGSSAKAIEAWSKTTADALGLSQRQALEAAGGFGTILQTAGLTEKQAASFSQQLVKLASDMASFNNIDPGQALEKLRSGLAGEAEPLRQVGVLLSENRVKQAAYANGIAKVGSELTEAQKVQARYLIILEDTAKQQGDFERTSDSLANSQRRVRAQFENASAAIGGALLPVVANVASALASLIPRVQASLSQLVAAVGPTLERFVAAFQDRLPAIQRIIGSVLDPLRERVLPILLDFAGIASRVWSNVLEVFDANRENLARILDNVGAVLANVWAVARPTIVFLFEKVLPAALNVAIPLLEKITGVVRVLSDVFLQTVSFILKAIDKFLGGITLLTDAASRIPGIGGKFDGVSDKINAVREDVRGFAGQLDALNGKQVDVTINIRTEGGIGRGEGAAEATAAAEAAKKATDSAEKVAKEQEAGAKRVQTAATKATGATKTAKTAAEKQRDAFDQLMGTLGLRRDAASETKRLDDDLRVLRATETALLEQIKVEGRTNELVGELQDVRQERARLVSQQQQGRQFQALGLTAEGTERVPGVQALRRRLGTLREQVKGTFLDTEKTRNQLAAIARVLSGAFGKVGEEVRQAIAAMFGDITDALKEGSGQKGPITKARVVDSDTILKGLGLSPDELRELRRRLSNVVSGGTLGAAGSRVGGAFGFAVPVGGGGQVQVNNYNVRIENVRDLEDLERQLERKSMRRTGRRSGTRTGGV
jgi:hypothetical protein